MYLQKYKRRPVYVVHYLFTASPSFKPIYFSCSSCFVVETQSVRAATIVVNSLSDTTANDGVCSFAGGDDERAEVGRRSFDTGAATA